MPVKGVDIATAKLKMCSLQESKDKDLLQMAREMELVMKPLSAYNNWAAFDKQESSSEDEKYVVVSQKADGKRGLVANGTTANDKTVNNVAPASAMAATSSSLVSRSAPKNPVSLCGSLCDNGRLWLRLKFLLFLLTDFWIERNVREEWLQDARIHHSGGN